MKRGLFITFEGPEGSGKTTQAKELVSFLKSKEIKALYSHEPGGTVLSEQIRSILINPANNILPLTELLLFEAARYQHVQEIILPNLEKGISVICDRFYDSTLAYQGARNLPLEWVYGLNELCAKDCRPDITFLLDVEVNTGFERILERYQGDTKSLDRIERENKTFFENLRKQYLSIANQEIAHLIDPTKSRWRIIDGSKSISQVKGEIQVQVLEFLKQKDFYS